VSLRLVVKRPDDMSRDGLVSGETKRIRIRTRGSVKNYTNVNALFTVHLN
jgi:hypothetical protein